MCPPCEFPYKSCNAGTFLHDPRRCRCECVPLEVGFFVLYSREVEVRVGEGWGGGGVGVTLHLAVNGLQQQLTNAGFGCSNTPSPSLPLLPRNTYLPSPPAPTPPPYFLSYLISARRQRERVPRACRGAVCLSVHAFTRVQITRQQTNDTLPKGRSRRRRKSGAGRGGWG